MTQPKHILFGTGAPQVVVFVDGSATADAWTQILDLREDPDQQIIRRVTLWAYRNIGSAGAAAPAAFAVVSVIDDSIITGTDTTNQVVGGAEFPIPATILAAEGYMPVKVLDDYPVRGPIRIVANASVQDLDADFSQVNNIVLFGYFTVDGEAGSRDMCDRRPFQIGSSVPSSSSLSVVAENPPSVPTPIHEPTNTYVDECEFRYTQLDPSADHVLVFGGLTPDIPLSDQRYMVLQPWVLDLAFLSGVPFRGCGVISMLLTTAGGPVVVNGHFIRY